MPLHFESQFEDTYLLASDTEHNTTQSRSSHGESTKGS